MDYTQEQPEIKMINTQFYFSIILSITLTELSLINTALLSRQTYSSDKNKCSHYVTENMVEKRIQNIKLKCTSKKEMKTAGQGDAS